jgi:HlyD family secretion protein
MDRKIEKPKWNRKLVTYGSAAVILVILGFFALRTLNKKTYRLDRDKITVKEVIQQDFQDIILIEGTVEPITSVLVNTPEGGNVEEIFAEDGVYVTRGTPLVQLSNPTLMLSYMTQETAIVEQINNLRNLKLSLEKDQRDLTESLIDIEYQLTRQTRAFQTDTFLLVRGAIPVNDYQDTYDNYLYHEIKREFLQENVTTTRENNRDQIARINKSIEMMERNLDVIHANIEKLLVRAPVSGMLSSFDPVIGEAFSGNQTIAKIDVMEGFKVRGSVDEYYLSRVKTGQSARFSFDGKSVELKVKKVLPEVEGGNFAIELVFVDEVPESITNGQSLQIRLELSAASQATLIPRGNFYQTSGGRFVFVMEGEDMAVRRDIRIGRQNPSYYEVLEGLSPGERIITSSYDAFRDFESIQLTN